MTDLYETLKQVKEECKKNELNCSKCKYVAPNCSCKVKEVLDCISNWSPQYWNEKMLEELK